MYEYRSETAAYRAKWYKGLQKATLRMITKNPKPITDRFRTPFLTLVVSGRIAGAVLMWVDWEFMVALLGFSAARCHRD